MDNRKKNLIIGYDLGDKYSQISWYDDKKGETESVCVVGTAEVSQIPTALCKNEETDIWLYGHAAIEAANQGKGTLITHFAADYEAYPKLHIGGYTYEKKELIGIFIRESLKLLETYFPVYAIAYMTITMRSVSKKAIMDIYSLSDVIGIGRENLRIQSHTASYEYFALSQKKDLWQHDVGLFEYDDYGLYYYHLSISKVHQPAVARASTFPLNMYLSAEDMTGLSAPDLDRTFLEVIKEALSQKIISTIFLTGKGFKGNWMNLSIKKLCTGRRVFIEDNLFSAGACYSSFIDYNQTNFKEFIALNDDIVPSSIYLRGSRAKEIARKELVTAGSCWYNINQDVRFLLDGTDTVVLHVRDLITNMEKLIPLQLENLPDRPDKTVTLHLNIQFESASICNIVIYDDGFGGLFPATNRCWKKRINVAEYETDKNFREKGRLIFSRDLPERIPYYFNISDTKIYSLEELCYYIYNNIYAVSQDMFSDDLFYWIEKSLLEPGLAKGFKNLKKSDASLKALVQYLMNYTDYYGSEEMRQINIILDDIEQQNPIEAKKVQADNLVKYCRYMEAIFCYITVVGMMEKSEEYPITKAFKGETYHNLAAAYMRVMNFSAAAANYKKAYDLNKEEASLKGCLWALKMAGDEAEFFDTVEAYKLSESYIEGILSEYDKAASGVNMGQRPEDEEALKVLKRLKNAYRS